MILYRIGLWYKRLGEYSKAYEYCREAYDKFPLHTYKNMAKECYEDAMAYLGRRDHEVGKKEKFFSCIMVDDDTLFVVNCTKLKIWEVAKRLGYKAPDKVPAILAYRGRTFLEFLVLLNRIENLTKRKIYWVVLSAKYGFLLPHDLISDYNVTFGQYGSISIDELIKQAKSKKVNGKNLTSFKRVYVYTESNNYYEIACKALNPRECIRISIAPQLCFILST